MIEHDNKIADLIVNRFDKIVGYYFKVFIIKSFKNIDMTVQVSTIMTLKI